MIANIETLKDTFKIGYEAYETSRKEALEVIDLYHNRQYTEKQLQVLADRGQPAETFNIIKLFGRMLVGYYSTIVNNIKVNPVQMNDIETASILQDLTDYIFRTNNFNSEGDKIKLDSILTGLMCSYVDVEKTGKFDDFGRPKYKINISHVPSLEIVLDPMSRLDDYSDARYIHRFKWMSDDSVIKLWGKGKAKQLDAYFNHLEIDEAEFAYTFNTEFHGKYRRYDNYLVVHTIITDEDDKTWSIYWCGEIILDKKEITFKEVKNPYRVQKLNTSNKTEHYGIFREVVESQHAINQALLKIQLMVNTQKAMLEKGAVEDIDEFKDSFFRVNSVMEVLDLNKIKIETLSKEILDNYVIIDKALDRIQRVLSINDSFLGMAYASDSGAKVKLQQNASAVAQRYSTSKLEQFYRLLGIDIVNLIKQYFTAHDVVRVADTYSGERWIEVNRPLMLPTSTINPDTGTPYMRPVFEEVLDPETNEPLVDEQGNMVMAPVPTGGSDISFTDADIEVDSISFNDEDEKSQLFLDSIINGSMGTTMASINPAGYFRVGSLAAKNTKNKYSLEIARIFDETASMISNNPATQQAMNNGDVEGQQSVAQANNQLNGGRA